MKLRIAMLAGLLAGCATDWSSVHNQAEAIQAGCRHKRLAGELSSRTASVQCATPGIRALYVHHNWPHMDLVELDRAQMLAIAERQDRGELSEVQADALYADVIARINSEIRARASADAQHRAAILSSMPIVCNKVGYTVVCN